MSTSFDAAEKLAARELDRIAGESGMELGFVPDTTEEVDEGWFFFWSSLAWWRSGDFRDQLAGNGPLFVSRDDGALHRLWTAESWEIQLERYRETGRFGPAR